MTALLWTFPLLMLASILIGWAAELLAVRLSAGIALAILAWLQTAPEFAVEANIAWQQNTHLALANLTGSLRLLIGLGWPVVFFIAAYGRRKRQEQFESGIKLPEAFAVEAAGLAVPVIYFTIIVLKGTWTTFDGLILCLLYAFYFWMLNRQRKCMPAIEFDDEDEPWVVERISKMPPPIRTVATAMMFFLGGGVLLLTVHPFVESLKTTALALGVSEFVFIQWIAPIASEFPEKVTAFGWARKPSRVPMAVVNMLSSVTSQWTLLAGLIPIVFSLSAGRFYSIELDSFQKTELMLTVIQSALVVVFLADFRVKNREVAGLFILWFLQFLMPSMRGVLLYVYSAWLIGAIAALLFKRERIPAWTALKRVFFGV